MGYFEFVHNLGIHSWDIPALIALVILVIMIIVHHHNKKNNLIAPIEIVDVLND